MYVTTPVQPMHCSAVAFRERTTPRSEATVALETVLTNVLDQRMNAFLQNPTQKQLQFEDGLSPFGRRYIHQVWQRSALTSLVDRLRMI